jgi:predicted small lipoprotein YifL
MKHVFLWLNMMVFALALAACGKSPSPPVAVTSAAGDPHAIEQAAMEAGTIDFSNLLIVRLQSEGKRLEVTSVLPATVAEASVSGQSAKTIFRVNEKSNGIILFSRDLLNGKSFRTEMTITEIEQKKSFNFPVVQPDASLKERSFTLEKIIRQP